MANAGNSAVAYAYLIGQGLTPAQSAGVVGNLISESGVQPNGANGDGGIAHGIAQWHPDRWGPLAAWAQGQGLDPNSLTGQLAMLWHELNTSETGALAGLRSTSTPSAAASSFAGLYERCAGCASGGGSVPGRIANALSVFSGSSTTGSTSAGSTAGGLGDGTDGNVLTASDSSNPCVFNLPGVTLPIIGTNLGGNCLIHQSQLRALAGGAILVAGGIVVLAGLIALIGSEAVSKMGGSQAVKVASPVASAAKAGAAGRAISFGAP